MTVYIILECNIDEGGPSIVGVYDSQITANNEAAALRNAAGPVGTVYEVEDWPLL